jgi:hypothetical protein
MSPCMLKRCECERSGSPNARASRASLACSFHYRRTLHFSPSLLAHPPDQLPIMAPRVDFTDLPPELVTNVFAFVS